MTNTGTQEGADIAEVYVGEDHPSVPRPAKELKGFARVDLRAGETKRVKVVLDSRAFSYYDVASHRWSADAAQFDILVGSSSAQIELTGKLGRQNP